MVQILCRDCPSVDSKTLFRKFVNYLLDTFQQICGQDLLELQHLTHSLYLKFKKPVLDGDVLETDFSQIIKLFRPHIQASLQTLFQHDVADRAFPTIEGGLPLRVIYMPLCMRFLLVASYIASYNPADADMRYFLVEQSARRKRRKPNQKNTSDSVDVSRQHLGPSAFPLERLAAIFHSLVIENGHHACVTTLRGQRRGRTTGNNTTASSGRASTCPDMAKESIQMLLSSMTDNVDLQAQLASLLSLKMLSSIPAQSNWDLDRMKFSCNISGEFAEQISKTIDVDLRRYLFDDT
jgi:origin recognition complex subunit 5